MELYSIRNGVINCSVIITFKKIGTFETTVNTSPDTPLSPNTKKRKSRAVNKICSTIIELGIQDKPDQIEGLQAIMKQPDLADSFSNTKKLTKAGRKLKSFETRNLVWKYWHNESTPSTLMSRAAKMKISDKSKIQSNLEFVDTVNIVTNKRGIFLYENPWRFTTAPIKCLYTTFLETNIEENVSYGTFLALKPFYIRGPTTSDIEMCCCKLYLHTRWSINPF